MPRPIEYEKSEILEKAMHLFWNNGYEQTSIRDVLEATGFNRHSLYEEFGGKDGLYKEVLNYYKDNIACSLIDSLQDKKSDLRTIRQIFMSRAEFDDKDMGCLFTNAANSKSALENELYQAAKKHNQLIEKSFETCLGHAQLKGQISKNTDKKLLSKYVATILHGLTSMSKMGISKAEIKKIGELVIKTLEAS